MVTFTEEILNGKLYFLHSIGSIKFVFNNVDLNLFSFFNFNLADLISLIYKIWPVFQTVWIYHFTHLGNFTAVKSFILSPYNIWPNFKVDRVKAGKCQIS